MKTLTPLLTDDGAVYLDLTAVVLVGPPVTKSGHAESRRVVVGSNYVFVLNVPENLTALGLVDEAQTLMLARAKKPRKRGRKAKQAETGGAL